MRGSLQAIYSESAEHIQAKKLVAFLNLLNPQLTLEQNGVKYNRAGLAPLLHKGVSWVCWGRSWDRMSSRLTTSNYPCGGPFQLNHLAGTTSSKQGSRRSSQEITMRRDIAKKYLSSIPRKRRRNSSFMCGLDEMGILD